MTAKAVLAAALLVGVLGAVPAAAAPLNIVINPGAGLASNAAALAAFNRAANQWASKLTDPITITINADLSNLGSPTIIGSTSSVQLVGGYDLIRNQLVADATAEGGDDAIVLSLPTAAQFSAFLPAGFTLSGNLLSTKADLKAMGFTGLDAGFGVTDATITFNSTFSFDFDNSNGVGPGLVDFETVAAHEIGHALGFISSVDAVDSLMSNSQTGAITPSILDLFRFRNNAGNLPTTTGQFTTNARDLVPGHDAAFADLSNTLRFSTGPTQGDGNQASHWKADELTGTLIGIMDPTLAFQTVELVSNTDLRAMDVIGYNINLSGGAAAPEPGALSLLLMGAATFPLAIARRRRKA